MSDEPRRPSDTVRLDRAAIEREMRRAADTQPPPPILAAIAEAQFNVELEVCCVCSGAGLVEAKRNARARFAMPAPPPDADDVPTTPITEK